MGVPAQIRENNLYLSISLAKISGMNSVGVYGSNILSGTAEETLWPGTEPIYPFDQLTSPTSFYFVSDSIEDSLTGTGAQRIFLEGLDENFETQTEVLETNGTTNVFTSEANWTRINKFRVAQVGSAGAAVGNITLYSEVIEIGLITAGNSRADQAVYTVPAGHTFSLTDLQLDFDAGKKDHWAYYTIQITDIDTNISYRREVASLNDSTASVRNYYHLPVAFGGKTDITINARASAGGLGVTAFMRGILTKDN